MFWDKWFNKSKQEVTTYKIKMNSTGVKQFKELHDKINDLTGKDRDIVYTWDLIINYGIHYVNKDLQKYTHSESKPKLHIVKPETVE